jgi:hypothetical protein
VLRAEQKALAEAQAEIEVAEDAAYRLRRRMGREGSEPRYVALARDVAALGRAVRAAEQAFGVARGIRAYLRAQAEAPLHSDDQQEEKEQDA